MRGRWGIRLGSCRCSVPRGQVGQGRARGKRRGRSRGYSRAPRLLVVSDVAVSGTGYAVVVPDRHTYPAPGSTLTTPVPLPPVRDGDAPHRPAQKDMHTARLSSISDSVPTSTRSLTSPPRAASSRRLVVAERRAVSRFKLGNLFLKKTEEPGRRGKRIHYTPLPVPRQHRSFAWLGGRILSFFLFGVFCGIWQRLWDTLSVLSWLVPTLAGMSGDLLVRCSWDGAQGRVHGNDKSLLITMN